MPALQHLARWASQLDLAAIPADVVHRAALQHVSLEAANEARATAPGDIARSVGASWLGDLSPLGAPAWGSALGARSFAADATWERVLVGTVAATEVVERLMLWQSLQSAPGYARVQAVAVGTAVATGHMQALGAHQLAHAIALALIGTQELPPDSLDNTAVRATALAEAAEAGIAACERAAGGATGSLDILEHAAALPGEPPFAILPEALAGLGERWMSRTLTYRTTPVAPWAQCPVQALLEIVHRHLKAASKRLRPDQVDEVEIRLDHLSWLRATRGDPNSLHTSLGRAAGHLIALAPDAPLRWDESETERAADAIADIADRTVIVPDLGLTLQWLRWSGRAWGPLLRDLDASARRQVLLRALYGGVQHFPQPDLDAWRHLWFERKADTLDLMRVGGSAPFRDHGLHVSHPTRVRVRTSRGGHWLERRDVVAGGPEYHLRDVTRDVVDKLEARDQGGRSRAESVLETGYGRRAVEVLSELGGA